MTPFRYRIPLLLLASIVAAGASAQVPVLPDPNGELPPAPDEPLAVWAPASPGNFQAANRPADHPIELVVIHDIEGSAEGAVRWFQNPQAKVSAHYVVKGGRIWQQVREKDIAWHAGNSDVNGRAIGIEHDGYAYRPGFYDLGLYETSARLVREVTTRWSIPRDRMHIIAHAEVPDPRNNGQVGGRSHHTDPGPYWDWDYYMTLVRSDARFREVSAPAMLHPDEKATVTATVDNLGDDPWPVETTRQNNPAVQSRGPVYLGLANQMPDASTGASPFYDLSWTSRRIVAAPTSKEDVAPGQAAAFSFTIQGPRALGTVKEPLRMVKVLPAPHLPVAFGPIIPLSVQVVPWDLTVTPEAPGWDMQEKHGERFYVHRFRGKDPSTPARWTATLPIDGQWEVFARGQGRRTKHAVYEVTDSEDAHTVEVDQRKPRGWVSLGLFRFRGAKPAASVTLGVGRGGGTVEAGPVRFVGPYPK